VLPPFAFALISGMGVLAAAITLRKLQMLNRVPILPPVPDAGELPEK
jgi:hypothetical protein